MLKTVLRYFTVFAFGALAYGLIEIMVRGFSHISMGLLGGLTMILISLLNNARRRGLPLSLQLIISTGFITVSELVTGIIININMQLNVWDYSEMPLNYKGQICVPFMFLWLLLSILGMIVDELLRWKFFKTDFPYLKFIKNKKVSQRNNV